MKKIKILYGLEAAGGGALKHLVYLVTRLDIQKFDVTVVLSNSRKECIEEEYCKMNNAGVNIVLMPMCKNINLINDFLVLLKIISLIKRTKFDIVHAHSSKAGGIFRMAAWFCSISTIYYTPHCFYFQGKTGIKKRCFVLLERILVRITTGIIVSESERDEILKNRICNKSKIININNAIDFNEYRQIEEIEKTKEGFGIKSDCFIVGAIGRLVPQKDWETYIFAANEVLKIHSKTIFLIVGEGELYTDIQKLIFKLNLVNKVVLTGQVVGIHKIYGIIDVFVNTSLWEGLPYVFLEAMRYKKPIIATNTGSDSMTIHNENGFVTPVKDYRSIAEKITFLIENKQLVQKIGENGHERLKNKFSFELFIKHHQNLYRKLEYQ